MAGCLFLANLMCNEQGPDQLDRCHDLTAQHDGTTKKQAFATESGICCPALGIDLSSFQCHIIVISMMIGDSVARRWSDNVFCARYLGISDAS